MGRRSVVVSRWTDRTGQLDDCSREGRQPGRLRGRNGRLPPRPHGACTCFQTDGSRRTAGPSDPRGLGLGRFSLGWGSRQGLDSVRRQVSTH